MPASIACIIFKDEEVAAKNKNGLSAFAKIFIAKRIPGGDMGERWEFPGGKVEDGEDCIQAIEREFMEEFGVPVRAGEKIASSVFYHKNIARELHAYRCYLDADEKNFALTEHTQTAWVSLPEVKKRSFVDSDLLLYDALEAYSAPA
jgi:8-oxo-dGTP diphosphatase